MGGCLNRPIDTVEPRTTSTIVEKLTQSAVDKIDLLLNIDNSRSMADKQQILALAIPDLVNRLVNPRCIDTATSKPSPQQPANSTDPCPAGAKREFNPVFDIHVGVITSSIGGHGADSCPNTETQTCAGGATNTSNNDHGQLVTRKDPCAGGIVPTYQNLGFLAWDPKGKLKPAGESDSVNFGKTIGDLVLGAGQIGCGYESQLESWYRFLVDPTPYATISAATGKAVPEGTDTILLQQRVDFLRPDSLVAIIMVTDENDCSTKEYGQFYFAAQQRDPNNPGKNFFLPKARSECATNPNDPCCKSCGQDPGSCPTDPNCGTHTDQTDDANLRCWDQKRRFGIDFLYPIDRYTTAIRSAKVPDREGNLVDNPLFVDLNPADDIATTRDPAGNLVFLAGIVGVPWQDIARDPANLANGGFKDYSELSKTDDKGATGWDYILGDPANYKAALDPHMIESTDPRSGTNPITGDTLAPPAQTLGGPDAINGHEYTVGTQNGVQIKKDDLQYACIFELLPNQYRDCSQGVISCDCSDPQNDNPLCDDNGASGRTLQKRAKAYPGIRELSVLKSVQDRGIVASACPSQITNAGADDYGYRPAVGAIIERLKTALGGQCLPRTLTPDKDGKVSCLILEGRATGGANAGNNGELSGGKCDDFCKTLTARQPVDAALGHTEALKADNVVEQAKASSLDCFCEITQLSGQTDTSCAITSELSACQCDLSDPPTFNNQNVNGWCYLDGTTNPPTGNVELVASCPDNEKRKIRFVGEGNQAPGSVLFITCSGE